MIRFPFLSSRPGKIASGHFNQLQMEKQHRLEKEQFRQVLASFHATRIKDRLTILDIFLATEQHLALSDLERIVSEQAPELQDRAFLKETMEMFCQFGFAKERRFHNQETQYEHHHLGMHHDHFICTRCGLIEEFTNPGLEQLQLAIARQRRFHPLQHRMEIYGLCADCMERREDTIPLLLAANGERVQIVRLEGGRQIQGRLQAMGLTVGTCLEVINNHAAGPFIVAVHGARVALGTGLAQKIVVAHACRHAAEPDTASGEEPVGK